MKRILMLITVLAALMLCSCTQTQTGTTPSESGNRHATVIMQDGTRTAGTVLKSSSAEITIAGDDQITRTIPMDKVQSIEYDTAPATPTAPATTTPEAAPAPQAAAQKAAAPPALKRAPAAGRTQLAPTTGPAPMETYEVPIGTKIAVRTDEAIDSSTVNEGQEFGGEVTKDVLGVGGEMAIPKGSPARIVILSASQGGRIRGASDLVLDLKSVTINGRRYNIETEVVSQRGRQGIGANKRTAEFTGGGAALGAIIGAIAGGGKGAAIGAASGAGAGALTQIITKGKSIKVPAETILTFKLDKPLRVTAAR